MCGRGRLGGLPVVSTLDTLPACEVVPWFRSVGWCATVPAVRVSDGLPVGLVAVVSTLDTLPAVSLCRGQSVGCVACSQYPRHPASGGGGAVDRTCVV